MKHVRRHPWATMFTLLSLILALVVLSHSPAAAHSVSTVASEDCAVSEQAQLDGWCCYCDDEIPPFYCSKSQILGTFDRCDAMYEWCGGACGFH